MDEILAKASNQAVTFAIRSGITLASGYAIRTVSKLLEKMPTTEKSQLQALQARLETKTEALAASFELIKISVARGNSALEPTEKLVDALKTEIDDFESNIARLLEQVGEKSSLDTLKAAEASSKRLLDTINDALPLISLSVIVSGVNMATVTTPQLSLSRLLEANSYLMHNSKATDSSEIRLDVDLKFYTVFYNPARLKYVEDAPIIDTASAITWKEEFSRATCTLERIDGKNFSYELVVTESFDDGLYHDDDDEPQVRRTKISSIEKQFFSLSGKLLKLENSDSPVLILKTRDTDVRYIAFGGYAEDPDLDSDEIISSPKSVNGNITLVRYILTLLSIQEREQMKVTSIPDEKLAVYLQDEAGFSNSSKKSQTERRVETSKILQSDAALNRLKNLSLNEPNTNVE